MSDTVIKVENLSKLYRLGELHKQTGSFRDMVTNSFKRLYNLKWFKGNQSNQLNQSNQPNQSNSPDYIWALRDVSFEVKEGEILGIIGRNGAGKSTLLKILSRITRPTEGKAWVNGRVGSLLEVGTGFHPELTGQENIYLNGAILGMKKADIERKFEEIVAFAEIEKFIDTPIKRYSSGMYVRLAFAVAAHLEPEILLVDEVLAVGDAAFQKKCLGKMGDVAREGRTVLFVSHNMAAVESLCSRAILLMQGSLKVSGFPRSVIASYLTSGRQEECAHNIRNRDNRRGNGAIRFVGFHLEDADGNVLEMVRTGQDVTFVFSYESTARKIDRNVVVSFAISNMYGASLILHRTNFTGQDFGTIPPIGQFKCAIPKMPLVAGRYGITGCVQIGSNIADLVEDMAYLNVVEGDFFGTGHYGWPEHSPFLIDGRWSVVPSHS